MAIKPPFDPQQSCSSHLPIRLDNPPQMGVIACLASGRDVINLNDIEKTPCVITTAPEFTLRALSLGSKNDKTLGKLKIQPGGSKSFTREPEPPFGFISNHPLPGTYDSRRHPARSCKVHPLALV